MTRPFKHQKTGTYWVRKVVPEELRPTVGQRELKRSLKTKDPAEAKRLAPAVIAELEQVIASARLGKTFTREDLQGLTGEYYRQRHAELVAEARRRNWGETDFTNAETSLDVVPDQGGTPEEEEDAVIAWAAPRVDALLARFGVLAPPAFRAKLAVGLYKAEHQAVRSAQAEVELHDEPAAPAYPTFRPTEARSISTLFSQYAAAKRISDRTREQWARYIEHFELWLNGKPADRVAPSDVQRYADSLLSDGGLHGRKLSAKTINESYIASINTTYAWAMKPGRALVTTNPAQGVSVEVPRSESGPRRRAYKRDEVKTILSAARLQDTPYKRWVPWLLAFTGARVSEILNAKKADLGQAEGVWYLAIREQAEGESGQRLKNTWSIRCVPIHSALIAEGFLRYAAALPDGEHLFPGKWSDKHGDRTKTPSNRLREWLNTVRAPEPGWHPITASGIG